MTPGLSPAQSQAYDLLTRALPVGNVFALGSGVGMGRTTIMRTLYAQAGGAFLSMRELLDATAARHPLAMEEAFESVLMEALGEHDLVILDDLHLLTAVVDCAYMYPRRGFIDAPLTALASHAAAVGKKILVGTRGWPPSPVRQRSYMIGIPDFTAADYRFLCGLYLPRESTDRLDYERIFRFAPKLNAHQLRGASLWLRDDAALTSDRFIDYLRSQRMAGNVNLGEVEAVDLRDLRGVDDVIRSLEANLIVPLENNELARELDLKPKRGVLLVGPPGTGKTTVGRALAHRLRSKFFLIDGTFISGTREFYQRLQQTFEGAKENAPSIIFIDDSDVIFESGEEMGLYRYLLTMLDGLESESAGRVCVMMTAMDVGNIPPALLRSGRIELWLEMRLPDAEARAAILRAHLVRLPESLRDVDLSRLVEATDEFTGADLKRLVEDGKTLYAYDRSQGKSPAAPTRYFLSAVETVRGNKELYAQAEARARVQRSARPPWFSMMGEMMSAGEYDEGE